jgi:phage terminase large subunit-like protein
MSRVTSLQFFSKLRWLSGTPLLDHIEQYRRDLFRKALDTFDERGRPLFNLVLAGRGKKNAKSLDLILAALFVLVIRRSVQGSDGYVLANDADQAGDDLALAKKLIAANADLANEIEVLANELRLKDGSAALKILPAKDIAGAHGKSAAFVGFDEIHGYKDWSLMEALQPDPTRPDALMWVTSYASLFATTGAPLHDLMQIGKAGKDQRMLFSWYSGDFTTDPAFADLPPLERANPSLPSWPDGIGYLEQQRTRLPTGRFRRLHLNLPGSPEGAVFDQGKVLSCVVIGRRALPFEEGRRYFAVVDMSGGSDDDAVLCITHADGRTTVIDHIQKQIGPAPFDPRRAVYQFCEVLKTYGIAKVTGDAFGGQTFRKDFADRDIGYEVRTTSASLLYEQLEPVLNAGEVELLDVPTLVEQLVSLVWKGSKITHENGAHDDFANACALAVSVARRRGDTVPMTVCPDLLCPGGVIYGAPSGSGIPNHYLAKPQPSVGSGAMGSSWSAPPSHFDRWSNRNR